MRIFTHKNLDGVLLLVLLAENTDDAAHLDVVCCGLCEFGCHPDDVFVTTQDVAATHPGATHALRVPVRIARAKM